MAIITHQLLITQLSHFSDIYKYIYISEYTYMYYITTTVLLILLKTFIIIIRFFFLRTVLIGN